MISFQHVSVTYDGGQAPVLSDVCLEVAEGTFALVSGPTGAGKSTLLGAINGHVPHFTGGRLSGRVIVDGLDTRDHAPRDMAGVVGFVGQDPVRGFVSDTVEEEIAYGMEQMGVAPDVMRRRVEDTLDLLGIAELRGRALAALSGGQQQRVAIASVLAAGARVLVLDEPTSALDPQSAEEVLAGLLRLVHDMGVTVVVAEHRLERVLEYADQVVLVGSGGRVTSGAPAEMMVSAPVAPPVVELGRLAGWVPLPLCVRDARKLAPPLRHRLSRVVAYDVASPIMREGLSASGIVVRYGELVALRGVSIEIPARVVTALMGRNGAGKSSLLWALTGVLPCQGGRWSAPGAVRLVPQTPGDLLYLDSVAQECATADRENKRPTGTCLARFDALVPGVDAGVHPRDLSEGQRLALALAVQMTARPAVLLLDEPTRGLDYKAKVLLGRALREMAAGGTAVCLATHDVEFLAQFADRAVVLASGEVIQTGPIDQVLIASATFTPQVAKIMAPERWLTVAQVADGLERADHE